MPDTFVVAVGGRLSDGLLNCNACVIAVGGGLNVVLLIRNTSVVAVGGGLSHGLLVSSLELGLVLVVGSVILLFAQLLNLLLGIVFLLLLLFSLLSSSSMLLLSMSAWSVNMVELLGFGRIKMRLRGHTFTPSGAATGPCINQSSIARFQSQD